MGNRKPCSFTLVSFKLTAPLRAPHFVLLSCTSFSDVGNSLQFPSACFLTSTGGMQRHKLRSRTSCVMHPRRWTPPPAITWVQPSSFQCQLADFTSGCGVAQVVSAWSCPAPLAEACPGSTQLKQLKLACCPMLCCWEKKKVQLKPWAGLSPDPSMFRGKSATEFKYLS